MKLKRVNNVDKLKAFYDTPPELDITDWKQRTAQTLFPAIERAVADTQKVVIRSLPNRILMTPVQYRLLENRFAPMYASEDVLLVTKHNVMEVKVKL